MRMIYLEEQAQLTAFAERAADCFSRQPDFNTYTDADIKPGCLFAVRWGLGKDCVIVFRIAQEHEVLLYCQLIKEAKTND